MMLQTGTKALPSIVAVFAIVGLMGQGLDPGSPTMSPSADEASPAVDNTPPATRPDIPSATAPKSEDSAVVVPVAKPPAAAKKEKTAKAASKTEILPWANAPLVAPGAVADPANAVTAATASQCAGLFEAPCREVATCAWVGDIKHEDGTTFPAHCAGRGTAPPKKAAVAKPKPKPTAAAGQSATAKPIKVSPPETAQAPAGDGAVVVRMPPPQ
jgi:hypothetical protein